MHSHVKALKKKMDTLRTKSVRPTQSLATPPRLTHHFTRRTLILLAMADV